MGIRILLFCAMTVLQVKMVECRVGCVFEGYDGGSYDEKRKICLCNDYLDYEAIVGAKFRLKGKPAAED